MSALLLRQSSLSGSTRYFGCSTDAELEQRDRHTDKIQSAPIVGRFSFLGRLSEPDASRLIETALREPFFLQNHEMPPDAVSALQAARGRELVKCWRFAFSLEGSERG